MKSFYNRVKSRAGLNRAWKKVLENGLISKSSETKDEIKLFAAHADQAIEKIYRALLHETFQFLPAKGVAQKKPGKKKPRPIVIAPIENRIVQRSILDALHSSDKICDYERIEYSFGGIEGRGVPDAIRMLYSGINDGLHWYIRSDISDFFTTIPREKVIQLISQCIPEDKFLNLVKAALVVELENMVQLGKTAEIFPIYTIGVAQGCCLSPLFGNLLLNEFDSKMNGRGIICIRYIDDFIILGKDKSNVRKTFENGHKILSDLGLKIHTPEDGSGKASEGNIKDEVNFLGCDIRPDRCRPDEKSRARILGKVDNIVGEAVYNIKTNNGKFTYLSTLTDIQHILQGWGHTYFFCNDKNLMRDMDIEIDKKLKQLAIAYQSKAKGLEDFRDRRRLQGIHLLSDSKISYNFFDCK